MRGRRFLLLDPRDQHSLAPLERSDAGQELVEDHSQAVDVGPGVNRPLFTSRLLGRHVCRGADHLAVQRGKPIGTGQLCQSEIGEEGLSSGVDQDVRWLDIAVDHAALMGVFQRIGQRGDPDRSLPEARPVGRQLVGEVLSLDQRADQVRLAIDLAGIVDRDDVRMSQDRSAAGFSHESVSVLGERPPTRPGPLERDLAAHRGVPSSVDIPEAPPPNHSRSSYRPSWSGVGGCPSSSGLPSHPGSDLPAAASSRSATARRSRASSGNCSR